MTNIIKILRDPQNPQGQGGGGGGMSIGMLAPVIGAAMDLAVKPIYDNKNEINERHSMQLQLGAHRQMTDYNVAKQLELWQKTGYGAQMKQMKEAGLNPALMYGMSGGGGQTASIAQGSAPRGQIYPEHGVNTAGMLSVAAQIELLKAQKENIQADTALKTANVPKTEAETQGVYLNNEFLSKSLNDRVDIINTEAARQIAELDIREGQRQEERSTRIARIDKVRAEAAGALLINNLLGEQAKEIQSKIQVNAAQITKWGEEIAQGWKGLDLREKELKIEAIMKEVEQQYIGVKTVLGTVPTHNAYKIAKQIDIIMGLEPKDFK